MKLLQRVLLTATFTILLSNLMAQVIENPSTNCPFTVSANLTYPTCPGGQDGVIELMIGNVDGTVDYEWIDDSLPTSNTDGVAEELFAGAYAIRVSDGSGCADTITFALVDPAPLMFDLLPADNSCAGDLSGSILVVPEGSAGDLLYSIETNVTAQTSPVFEALQAGTYNVTIEDSNGCLFEQTTTIFEPDSLQVNLFKQDVSCPAEGDGIIEIQATGGTGLKEYSLDGVDYTQNGFFTNLNSGEHLVHTKDENLCIDIKSIMIEEPVEPTLNILLDSVSCPGAGDAQMIIIIESGVFLQEQYEFSTDGSIYQSDSLFTDLEPGEHEVYARDPNGCIRVDTVSIADAPETEIDVEVDSVSCPGGSDGEMIIIIESGVFFDGQYLYSIDGMIFQTDSVFTGLTAGIYTVYVMDPNGCVFSMFTQIEEPVAPVVILQIQDATCNGGSDGSLDISADSGSSPSGLEFSLDSINYQTETLFENLSSANYTIYIRNSNGCVFVDYFSIGEPQAIISNMTFENETCSASNGEASCTPSGGTGGYQYLWSNGRLVSNLDGLIAGNYLITITDDNACEIVDSILVRDEAAPKLKAKIVEPSCPGSKDGAIELQVISEQNSFDYYWTTGSESKDIYVLNAGEYSVTVGDANDCVTTQSFEVESPQHISIEAQITYQNNLGSIATEVLGGSSPYTYQWSNGLNIANISSLEAGDYWLTVTDNQGCQSEKLFILEMPFNPDKDEINIYPIPTMDVLFIDLNLSKKQLVNLRLFDARGVLLIKVAPQLVEKDLLRLNLQHIDAALYWLVVELEEKVISRKVIKVTD